MHTISYKLITRAHGLDFVVPYVVPFGVGQVVYSLFLELFCCEQLPAASKNEVDESSESCSRKAKTMI